VSPSTGLRAGHSTGLRTGRQERLSIIVPVFNEARTVRAVIDRLLTIDLPIPREILIVDDGSSDGTGEVLDAAAPPAASTSSQITARLLRGGHRIHELPVRFDPRSRAEGKKIKWRDGVRALQVLLRERFAQPPPSP
jgi:hypothetical protein